MKGSSSLIGGVPTDAKGFLDFFKDLFKFKLAAILKGINIRTAVGTHIYATGKMLADHSIMLCDA